MTLRAFAILAIRTVAVVAHAVVLLSIVVSGLGIPPWFLVPGLVLWGAGVWFIVRWWCPHPELLLLVPGVIGLTYWIAALAIDAARLFPAP